MPDFSKTIGDFCGEKGPGEAKRWLEQITTSTTLHHWPDEFAYETAKNHLQGAARNWYEGRIREMPDWTSFRLAFERTFLIRQSKTELWSKMKERVQEKNENISAYFHEKVKLCKQLELPFEEVKEQVAIGLWSREASNFVLSKFHVDEDYLFQDLLQHERIEVARRNRVLSSSSGTSKAKTENAGVSRKTVVKNETSSRNGNRLPTRDKNGQVLCFKCRKYGHYARNCPDVTATSETAAVKIENNNVNHVEIGSPNLKYFKDVLVNGTQVQGYVDFGSQICAIQDKYVPLLGLVCDLRDRENIIGYGGAKIETLGAVKVEIKIDEVKAMTKVYVVPAECQRIPILIGQY
uniref:CCHC-type domain-containing protein n=1 Tax=Zophobas morio TaxID=2755281 RepID=A0AA38MLS2_9CUCU|nr:hypothetical protein Zmor_006898 [Zophobas morio]